MRTLRRIAALIFLPSLASVADEPKPPAADAEASRLLGEMIAAYRAVDHYADRGEITSTLTVNGRRHVKTKPTPIGFDRPRRLRIDTPMARYVDDGESTSISVTALRRFQVGPSPASFDVRALADGPLSAPLFGDPTGLPLLLVLNLLASPDPAKFVAEIAPRLAVGPDGSVDGEACRSILLDAAEGPDLRVWPDPKSKLARKIDLLFDSPGRALPGTDVVQESLGWTSGAISTAAPGADAFATRPPAGFLKVATLQDAVGGKNAPAAKVDGEPDGSPLVGKPAPDFRIYALDGPGKPKPLSAEDFKGKVLAIDFWATWCGPCLREMPEVRKMVDAYAAANKDVRVVALSIDDNDGVDLESVRKKIEETLKEAEIVLGGNAVGLVAVDPAGAVSQKYGVQAIPSLVLIDREGVVRAVHVGYTGRDVLTAEIDALLEGKAIPGPAKAK